jgi:S1-C subfamily serine protease
LIELTNVNSKNISNNNMKAIVVTNSIYFYVFISCRFCSSFVSPANHLIENHGVFIGSSSLSKQEEPTYVLYSTPSMTHVVRSSSSNNHDSTQHSTSKKKTGLESLSVTELKKLLLDRNVDFRDCLEKRDLIERLENTESSSTSSVVSSDSDLTPEENRVIRTFKRVSPCVAFIQTTSVVQTIQGLRLKAMEIPSGTGSGFLWDDQGHVVTNYHVIANGNRRNQQLPSNRMKVKLPNMAEARDAIVIGYEPDKDLAVLKLTSTTNLPKPIDVGTSCNLQVGQSVLAIGNPYGLDDTLTTGVVSALGREVEGFNGRPIKGCIQTDAAINPGNSGGPLLDSSGRLVSLFRSMYCGLGSSFSFHFLIPVSL